MNVLARTSALVSSEESDVYVLLMFTSVISFTGTLAKIALELSRAPSACMPGRKLHSIHRAQHTISCSYCIGLPHLLHPMNGRARNYQIAAAALCR